MIKDNARSQHGLQSVLTCLTFALPCLLNSKLHRVIEEEEWPPESSSPAFWIVERANVTACMYMPLHDDICLLNG